VILEAGQSPPLTGLELALEEDVADHPPLAGHGVEREQPDPGQLVAALVAIEAPEQLVAAADREQRSAALDSSANAFAVGREGRGDQLLLAVLPAADVVEVVLAGPHNVVRTEPSHLDLVSAPGRAAGQHRHVAAVGVDVEVVREEVTDDNSHSASSASGSVAQGKPGFPREPPSSSKRGSACTPRRWARSLRISIQGTFRFPITPSTQPLTRLSPPSRA